MFYYVYYPMIPFFRYPRQYYRPSYNYYPYVDTTVPPFLKFGDVGKELKLRYFNLGFIVATSKTDHTASWGGYKKLDDPAIMDEIKKVKAHGGEVTVSFGGSDHNPIPLVAPSAELAANEYIKVIKQLGLRQIDFDIEGNFLVDPVSVKKTLESIAVMQRKLKEEGRYVTVWFTLPVLPTGLTGYGIQFLEKAGLMGVDYFGVNIMAMDYGDANTPDPRKSMAEYAIMACRSTARQLTKMTNDYGIALNPEGIYDYMGVTIMAGVNDVKSEVTYPKDAEIIKRFANQVNMNRVSIWSLNRDRPCSKEKKEVNPAANCSGIDQKEYEFSRILNQ